LTSPTGIDVSRSSRVVFVVNRVGPAFRFDYDDLNPTLEQIVLLDPVFERVLDFTVDDVNRKLYIADYSGRIYRSNFDGSELEIVHRSTGNPFFIAVMSGNTSISIGFTRTEGKSVSFQLVLCAL